LFIACQNRVQILALSIEDSKKLIDDIDLQNHWHTVLAHRATTQSPVLISTGIFVFFGGITKHTSDAGTFNSSSSQTQNSWEYRIGICGHRAGNVKKQDFKVREDFLEKTKKM
jgi:hypothetical protein